MNSGLVESRRRRIAIANLRRETDTIPYKAGCRVIAEVLRAPADELDGIRILRLLTMPREVGERKAGRLLAATDINPDRRLRQLSPRQRELLAQSVENSYRPPAFPTVADGAEERRAA